MIRLSAILACLLAAMPVLPAAAAPMVLGVQTHFAQGWPIDLLDIAKDSGAPPIRDGVGWAGVEKSPGNYDFAGGKHIATACRKGFDVLAVVEPRNRLYDGGAVVASDPGRNALAAFVLAMLDKYPCVIAIEVGNEINGNNWFAGPAAADPAGSYVALLRTLYPAVKARHPKVAVLGGSTNVIGIGFLESLFARGMLDVVDGVVVHPYRSRAESVDMEFTALNDAMRRHGPIRPIWATEFSDNFNTPEMAPPMLLKMVAMMSASNVERAYWYALIDQRWFRNMGLYEWRVPKPAAHAFIAAQGLLRDGSAVRLATEERDSFIYRFGNGAYVMWGAPRPISFSGTVRVRNAQGQQIATPAALADEPIIVEGASGYTLGTREVLADSLYGFGQAPWSYVARKSDGSEMPMRWTNGRWTSNYSVRGVSDLWVAAGTVAAGPKSPPIETVVRYTAPESGRVKISACLTKPPKGDGMLITIRRGDEQFFQGKIFDRLLLTEMPIVLQAGDRLDFAFRPLGAPGGNLVSPRIRIVREDAALTPACL